MKVSIIALALAAFATTSVAYASAPTPAPVTVSTQHVDVQQLTQWPAIQGRVAPKTRAEVRQELVEAQKDGQLAYLNKLYLGS